MIAGLAGSAVLFDLDGVLVRSTDSVRRSWTEWAGRHGLDPSLVLAASSGVRSVDTIRRVAPSLDAVAEATRLEVAQALDVTDVVAGLGAADLLGRLARPEWAVVTSGTKPLATARLRAAGLAVPEVLVTAEQVERGKPDPAGYLLAARLLGKPARECVVVEDAEVGVEAGHRAGMKVVGVANGRRSAHLAGADLVVESLADLEVADRSDDSFLIRIKRADGP
ncbi:MAG: HAD-IA family hydrolase [Saccharothrix sp.]|nr:HAD-IA family hydrolase [Saccharothrix sp.]